MKPYRRTAFLLHVVLVCFLFVFSAAARDVVVPVQVITAETLENLPTCGRTLLDAIKIPPAPALNVTRGSLTVPEEMNTPSLLNNLRIRTGDGRVQPAIDPFCVENVEVLKSPVEFLYGDDAVAGVINVVTSQTGRTAAAAGDSYRSNFFAEPLLNPGQVQIIRGPFDGLGPGTSVHVGGTPGLILAETGDALFWTVPENTPHGSISITVMDAGRGATFPVYILGLAMSADQVDLLRGQSTRMQATVFGPELIPSEGWRAGDVSPTIDLGKVAQAFPDFKIPKPGDPGVLFFRLDNASRETVSMRPSKNESFLVNLGRKDFAKGPYTYTGTIQSRQSGGFIINGMVVAFFAPIPGKPLAPDAIPVSDSRE